MKHFNRKACRDCTHRDQKAKTKRCYGRRGGPEIENGKCLSKKREDRDAFIELHHKNRLR